MARSWMWGIGLSAMLALAGCAEGGEQGSSAQRDAGDDGGPTSGGGDANPSDSGESDGGENGLDSGFPPDGGAGSDAGEMLDAEADQPDATPDPDAGPAADANVDADATTGADAGPGGCPADAGTCTAFAYMPSNFDPMTPGLTPEADVTLDCGTSQFDSSDLSFDNWCDQASSIEPVEVTQSNGPDLVVVPMQGLTIGSESTLRLVGDRPVVVAVYGGATIDGTIDASADGATPGTGGNVSCGDAAGSDGESDDGAGGGGGGAFGAAGASGGDGDEGAGGAGGSTTGNAELTPLRGGCPGGAGGEGTGDGGGAAGAGGGAVQLAVAGMLQVNGVVTASGGGGQPGSDEDGGGGGGSGGGVRLEADMLNIASDAWITANGGGGAGGSGDNSANPDPGADGSASSATPASGSSGEAEGGDGGDGGTETMAATGGDPASDTDGGGGGGGGTVGRIRARGASGCTLEGTFSPGATSGGACN